MLVLVSFVLVLAAAVTLVVGLLQSGLTLIYLSIACSVLAGVVLAVAVLRGRPEPKPAAVGRGYSPPRAEAPVAASVGAARPGAETTGSWSTPTATAPPAPPPAPYAPPSEPGGDLATKAAGAALLGRLRGKRGDKAEGPEPLEQAAPAAADSTTQMPAVEAPVGDDGGFPIPNYDRLRATELLSHLGSLDRNQLEAVRDREANGKNRFTILSRIDTLLSTAAEPAWEVDEGAWDSEDEKVEAEVLVSEPSATGGGFGDDFDDEGSDSGRDGALDTDRTAAFPIASYDTLTVGQILPRLSELDPDELAQVRAREEMGRNRATILDRIDRLASRRAPAPLAMPAAAPPAGRAPARRAPAASRAAASRTAASRTAASRTAASRTAASRAAASRTAASKAAVSRAAVSKTSGPAVKRVAKAPSRKSAAAVVIAPATKLAPARRSAATRAASAAKVAAQPIEVPAAPRKARASKASAAPVAASKAVRSSPAKRTKKA